MARLDDCSHHWATRPVISIHAARVDGDSLSGFVPSSLTEFQSTPPGWTATVTLPGLAYLGEISIHAARVDGDLM